MVIRSSGSVKYGKALTRTMISGPRSAPPWLPGGRTRIARGYPWGGPCPVLHVALGFIDPAFDLENGEVMLSRDLRDRDLVLEDVHDQGRFALRGPSLDGGRRFNLSS